MSQVPPFVRQHSASHGHSMWNRNHSRFVNGGDTPPIVDNVHLDSGMPMGSPQSTTTSSSSASLPSLGSAQALGGQAQYMVQEQAYIHKLRSSMMDDYYGKELHPVGQVGDIVESDLDSEDEGLDAWEDVAPSSLQSTCLPLSLDPNDAGSTERIRERSEWQNMLTSVLTGEIFTSEKSRLEDAADVGNEEHWLELKAKVTCRTLSEQRRLLAIGRSTAQDVIERVMHFKLGRVYETIDEPFEEVGQLLDTLGRCEALWPTRKAMLDYLPSYASEEVQSRIDALTSWYTVTASILEELELLYSWTGNNDADPTQKPVLPVEDSGVAHSESHLSLVERIVKQEGALTSIFHNHIQRCLFPLIERARECTIENSSQFVALGLPLFLLGLGPVIAFPVKVITAVIDLRLGAASRLHNPTMIMIDDAIEKFQNYMSLGLVLAEEYVKVTKPVLDKGWLFDQRETSINASMLRCIGFYLDLLSNKFLDGGRTSMSFFRSFKSIEQLELHFNFLQETCRLIDGGDISVAEQFTGLHSRVLSRLLAYWEHQMEGPAKWTKFDIDRWYASTIENIRSIQRKLLRFYKTLSNTYENAIDFTLPKVNSAEFLEDLRENDFFLVFVGSTDRLGVGSYAFASRNLMDKPEVIKNLLQGHCRPPPSGEDIGAIVLFSVSEALRWDGEVFQLDVGTERLPQFNGEVRLIAQGGYREAQDLKATYEIFDALEVVVARRSHLDKVEAELHKMRTVTYRLTIAVITSAMDFRKKMKKFNCQETVQAMFSFAREFGQRGLPLVSEARRGRVIMRLFDLCVEWVQFVSDDCPPSENKTFKWTVQALEFAMMMTRGVNILAVKEEQFQTLRRKVADCVTLLISHFDIMGARSKAATLTNHHNRARLIQQLKNKQNAKEVLNDDDEVIAAHRESTLELLHALEMKQASKFKQGKILDQNNATFEFLSFASSPLTTAAMRWQRGDAIGSGAFGSVFKARNLDNFQTMAVKEVKISSEQGIRRVLKSIKDEMTVLEMVSHPNIVQYYGVEIHRERVFIFMEYCNGGSLADLLAESGRIQDEEITRFYSLQMLEGLAYLHQSGIVHRDVKPENILLNYSGQFIKFVDFGAAKIIADRNVSAQTNADNLKGTPMYMAPEVIKGKRTANLSSVDIWSIGCVILQMATGLQPWSKCDNVYAVMYCLGMNKTPDIPNDGSISDGCRQILERTLEYNPLKRPSAMELLRDAWFDKPRQTLLEYTAYREEGFDGDYPMSGNASPEEEFSEAEVNISQHNAMDTISESYAEYGDAIEPAQAQQPV